MVSLRCESKKGIQGKGWGSWRSVFLFFFFFCPLCYDTSRSSEEANTALRRKTHGTGLGWGFSPGLSSKVQNGASFRLHSAEYSLIDQHALSLVVLDLCCALIVT
jgi:hypothetical protein